LSRVRLRELTKSQKLLFVEGDNIIFTVILVFPVKFRIGTTAVYMLGYPAILTVEEIGGAVMVRFYLSNERALPTLQKQLLRNERLQKKNHDKGRLVFPHPVPVRDGNRW